MERQRLLVAAMAGGRVLPTPCWPSRATTPFPCTCAHLSAAELNKVHLCVTMLAFPGQGHCPPRLPLYSPPCCSEGSWHFLRWSWLLASSWEQRLHQGPRRGVPPSQCLTLTQGALGQLTLGPEESLADSEQLGAAVLGEGGRRVLWRSRCLHVGCRGAAQAPSPSWAALQPTSSVLAPLQGEG